MLGFIVCTLSLTIISKPNKMQILTTLFDITSLMPHGYCLIWNSVLLWLHVISDVLIVLSYYSIPFIILFYVRKHKDFPFDRLLLMLSAFIIACGTTHLVSIITIWIPLYWLEGLLKLLTGLLSVITAITMYFIVPKVLAEMGRKLFLEEKLATQASTMQENRKRLILRISQSHSNHARLS